MRARLVIGAMLAVGITAGGLSVAQCLRNQPGSAAVTPGEISVTQARTFQEYPLLWLGDSFEGIPLTTIIRALAQDDPESMLPTAQNSITFIYGDCTPPAEEGGCAPPLQIVVEPRCFNPPELYSYVASGPQPIRGGAAWLPGIPGGPILWTGDIAVTIFAPRGALDRIIASLEPANSAAVGSKLSSVLSDVSDPRGDLVAPPAEPCGRIKGRSRADLPQIAGMGGP